MACLKQALLAAFPDFTSSCGQVSEANTMSNEVPHAISCTYEIAVLPVIT